MAGRNGSGVFTVSNPDFVSGTTISSSEMDANFADVATALTQSIAVDGQTTITGNLPMATYRHTGVGNAAARTDYAAAGQVQDSGLVWGGTAGGTANALTLTLTPAITAYATGQRFAFKAGASPSSAAATININSVGAVAIERDDVALSSSSIIEAGKYYEIIYDGAAFQLSQISAASETSTDSITAGTTQTQAGATALTTVYNQVTTCANFLDGVALPSATAGANKCVIINAGANAVQVWPANGSSETIAGGSADAADVAPLWPGEQREYSCVDGIDWFPMRPPGMPVLINTTTASGASAISFTSSSIGDGTYDVIVIELIKAEVSTDATNIYLAASIDGGSNYNRAFSGHNNICNQGASTYNGAAQSSETSGALVLRLCGTGTGETGAFVGYLFSPGDTAHYKGFVSSGALTNSGGNSGWTDTRGDFETTSAINAFQIAPAAGTLSCVVNVYGIKK